MSYRLIRIGYDHRTMPKRKPSVTEARSSRFDRGTADVESAVARLPARYVTGERDESAGYGPAAGQEGYAFNRRRDKTANVAMGLPGNY